jgi:hypothetical protein
MASVGAGAGERLGPHGAGGGGAELGDVGPVLQHRQRLAVEGAEDHDHPVDRRLGRRLPGVLGEGGGDLHQTEVERLDVPGLDVQGPLLALRHLQVLHGRDVRPAP